MIDPLKLREEILSDAADDYFGLYEIIWSLNAQFPDVSRALKVAAAREATADLLKEGRISLYRTVWASNCYDPVPLEEALRAVSTALAWEDPSEGPYLCYGAV